MDTLRLIRWLKVEKCLIIISNDPKNELLYSQNGLERSLAAVGLRLLHADGLIYSLHLAMKDISQ